MSKDELEEYLDALDRRDCYRVDAVLKDSAVERTERVFFQGNNGSELGPFVRKTFPIETGQGSVYAKIFRAQQTGKRLAHIQHIHDCYSTDSSIEVILEFVEGQTLQEYIEEHGPSHELATRVFPALCDAVSELHEAFDPPIIHRDLTPANIIVSEGGITVIDLGIARLFKPGAIRDTVYLGTRDFAPPEQFGFAQTDIRTDVYSLGKILRYCLDPSNDEVASSGDRRPDEATDEVSEPAPAATSRAESANIDPYVGHVIGQATNLDPEMRYRSVAQMKDAFLEALDACNASLVRQSVPAPASVSTTDSAEVQVRAQSTDFPEPDECARVEIPAETPFDPSMATPAGPPKAGYDQGFVQAPTKKMSIFASIGTFIQSAAARIPKSLGIVWDVCVGLFCLLLFAVSFELVLAPESDLASLPLWFRAVEVYGIAIIPIMIVAYYLLDLRLIREAYPNLKLLSRRKTWYFVPIAIIALWAVVVVIASACGYAQPSA